MEPNNNVHLPMSIERYKDPMPTLDQGHVRLVDVMGDDFAVSRRTKLKTRRL